MKKELLVVLDGNIGFGGTFMFVYNLLPYLEQKYKITFLQISTESDIQNELFDLIQNRYEVITVYSRGFFYICKSLLRALKKRSFDVIHINFSHSYLAILCGFCLKINKSRHVILHSHSNGQIKKGIIGKLYLALCKFLLNWLGDEILACLKEAGIVKFGYRNFMNRGIVIKDSINISKYIYSDDIRYRIRRQIKISDECFVIISVGRLSYEKNQIVLIRALPQIVSRNKNVKLILVGSGTEYNCLKNEADKLNVSEYVYFAGNQKNVNEWLCAADVFAFPSYYEGFGIAALEAQASGLPVLCSPGVTSMINVSGKVRFVKDVDSIEEWCSSLVEHIGVGRYDAIDCLKNNGFDAETNAKFLIEIFNR